MSDLLSDHRKLVLFLVQLHHEQECTTNMLVQPVYTVCRIQSRIQDVIYKISQIEISPKSIHQPCCPPGAQMNIICLIC